jgi:hypothetical protein
MFEHPERRQRSGHVSRCSALAAHFLSSFSDCLVTQVHPPLNAQSRTSYTSLDLSRIACEKTKSSSHREHLHFALGLHRHDGAGPRAEQDDNPD